MWASTIVAAATLLFVSYRPDLVKAAGVPDSFFNAKGSLFDPWLNVAYLASGVITGLIVSSFTQRTPDEQLDQFYSLIHTPVRDGEELAAPCTLPENPEPRGEKLFSHPDIELPKPTLIGLGGFVLAWVLVGIIIWLTKYLAQAV